MQQHMWLQQRASGGGIGGTAAPLGSREASLWMALTAQLDLRQVVGAYGWTCCAAALRYAPSCCV